MQDTILLVKKCLNVAKSVKIKMRNVHKLLKSVYVVNAEVNNFELRGYTQKATGAGD